MKLRGHPIHRKHIWALFIAVIILVGLWNVWKPLPSEINKEWSARTVVSSDVTFLADTTYTDAAGDRFRDQHIFDEVKQLVRIADSYILIDMFLWNDFLGKDSTAYRSLSHELANELILKKKTKPETVIQVISDPINTSYFGEESAIFRQMEESGISVTYTNLPALRDSNPLYSTFWRIFVFPIDTLHSFVAGSHYTFRWMPNIINSGGERVTLRSLLNLANFKANHRKLIVVDTVTENKREYVSLVTSANPHDGSSSHSNVALKIKGPIAEDIIKSEGKIIELAGKDFTAPLFEGNKTLDGDVSVSLVTDRAIQKRVIKLLADTKEGDTVDLLMFYLSDSAVIDQLIAASKRGVQVRLILDPNKDAFGMKKNGIPNREVADSLTASSNNISIRWCDTQGEQCHGKMLIINSESNYSLMLGSANYTRRNIGGYNLESNVLATGEYPFEAWFNASDYFEQLWSNEDFIFSTNYETYKDNSIFKKIIAWLMETTGVGTF